MNPCDFLSVLVSVTQKFSLNDLNKKTCTQEIKKMLNTKKMRYVVCGFLIITHNVWSESVWIAQTTPLQ
jgi:hypothetical protein